MIPDIILVISAFVVPLVVRPRWLVVVLVLVGAGLAGVAGWNAGLEEDVPPVMIVFAFGCSAIAAVVVAVGVHAAKAWFLRRRLRKH